MSDLGEWVASLSDNQASALLTDLEIARDARVMKASLAEFVRGAWPTLEPGRPLLWNWHLDVICAYLEAVRSGKVRRLLVNIPPGSMKSLLVSVLYPAWTWTSEPTHRFLCGSNEGTLATRDALRMRSLVESSWYQDRWPDVQLSGDQREKTLFQNTKRGHRESQGVTGKITGKRGDTILWDDPHDTKQTESDVMRQGILDSWDMAWSSRMNDPDTSAAIVIMQRIHQKDITGHMLTKEGQAWVHLAIPMRFDPDMVFDAGRDIGRPDLVDPRTEPGQLMFADRYSERAVRELEGDLGPYGCTPAESPILMADLSYKPISSVRAGDEVIGFTTPVPGIKRSRLIEATVLETFEYTAPVFRLTLDSGAVIRCTEDHKWFRRHRDADRPTYLPATVGTRLARVCHLGDTDVAACDQREAGWLAGFFDGDGSCSVNKRKSGSSTGQIQFYQGAGRNGPLCDRLEAGLTHFGFEFFYTRDQRKDPKAGANYEYRQYRVVGCDLPMFQKFLHQIRPTKWRHRMVQGALNRKWVLGRERVVSMEPDGTEKVYALKTTTGNYVVWGLASSNSAGQLQQRPSPKGGGEMRKEWLMRYQVKPTRGNKIVLVDPAGERKPGAGKRDNTAMGLFLIGEDGNYYLIDAYRDRLNLTERADILFRWHREHRPLAVGYERYGMQTDVAHLRDRMEREQYRFKITELGGSMAKEDRIRRLIPLLAAGRLWLPEHLHRTNSDGRTVDIIDRFIEEEYLPFPVGARDDFLDMMSRIMDDDIKTTAVPPKPMPRLTVREHQFSDRSIGY